MDFHGEGDRGKTDNTQLLPSLISHLESVFEPQAGPFKSLFPTGVCIYGEGYGAKINKGGNYSKNPRFVLFDVMINNVWLAQYDVEDFAARFEFESVPIVGEGTLLDMVQLGQKGFNSKWGDFLAEGIVARPATRLFTVGGSRIITKIKYKDFH